MADSFNDFSNCVRCGGLYRKVSSALCPHCIKKEQSELERVKDYLRFNRGASMEQTVEDTGIEVGRITNWIRLGHLVLSPESPIKYACENGCGTMIQSGRYCRKCVQELSEVFQVSNSDGNRNKGHGFFSKE